MCRFLLAIVALAGLAGGELRAQGPCYCQGNPSFAAPSWSPPSYYAGERPGRRIVVQLVIERRGGISQYARPPIVVAGYDQGACFNGPQFNQVEVNGFTSRRFESGYVPYSPGPRFAPQGFAPGGCPGGVCPLPR